MLQLGTNGMEQEASVNHCCCYTQSEAKREFGQGVISQGGDASVRKRSKNNNLLLHEMQAPNVVLRNLLLLQTLELLEMVMWKA